MVLEKLSPYKWNKLLHIKGGGEWVTVLISKLWVSNHEFDLGSSLVLNICSRSDLNRYTTTQTLPKVNVQSG